MGLKFFNAIQIVFFFSILPYLVYQGSKVSYGNGLGGPLLCIFLVFLYFVLFIYLTRLVYENLP